MQGHISREPENPTVYIVRCGEWDVRSDQEPLPHQDRRVARVTLHPSYKTTRYYDNNVALLHLEKEFNLADHISTVCLPDEALGEESYSRTGCWATGWGTNSFGERERERESCTTYILYTWHISIHVRRQCRIPDSPGQGEPARPQHGQLPESLARHAKIFRQVRTVLKCSTSGENQSRIINYYQPASTWTSPIFALGVREWTRARATEEALSCVLADAIPIFTSRYRLVLPMYL